MNKNLHNIDNIFRASIDGHEEQVPGDIWQNIDHSLDKKQAAFYKRKYFAVRAAAILFLLAGGITIAAILHFTKPAKVAIEEAKQNTSAGASSGDKENKPPQIPDNVKPEEIDVDSKQGIDNENGLTKDYTPSREETKSRNTQRANKQGLVTLKTERTANGISRTEAKRQNVAAGDNTLVKGSGDMLAAAINPPFENKEPEPAVAGDEESGTINHSLRHFNSASPWLEGYKVSSPIAFLSGPLKNAIVLPAIPVSLPPKKPGLGRRRRSWSLSADYAQNINVNTLKEDDHFRDPRNSRYEVKRTEQESTSFTTGIAIRKQLSGGLALQTAVHYFSSVTNIEPKTIFARPDAQGDIRYQFRCSSGDSYISTKTGITPAVGDSIQTRFSKSSLSYLQVPLIFSYQVQFGKFSILPSAGIQTNFLLGGKLSSALAHPTGEEEVSSSIDGLRSMYFSGVVQPQVNYALNDRLSIDLNPNFNFSLSPINKETAVKTYHNLVSVGAGIRLKL